MKRFFKVMIKAVKIIFIVFCVYLGSLCFREAHIPGEWVDRVARHVLPADLILHVHSVSVGIRQGVSLRDFRLYDRRRKDMLMPVVSASLIEYDFFTRHILAEGLTVPRLPDSYYSAGNTDRNAKVEATFPRLKPMSVTLLRADILSVRPERLTCDIEVTSRRIDFQRIRLDWPDRETKMGLDGFCYVDLDRQEVYGEVKGLAKQAHIRPLLVTVDIPSALPYMDAFTEVPEPCPSWCAWKVNLENNDFDLWLDLHPSVCRYQGVPMRKVDGKIHVSNGTRNNCLNYKTTVGPIDGTDAEGRKLAGTVVITGTNGNNTVTVDARSAQPLADLLKIGGFTGQYVGPDVIGDSDCRLQFRFPRSMTNNHEVLNGCGHLSVRSGRLMRLPIFKGLIDAMPSVAPAVTWLSDSTQASGDYVIENGVLKSDNIYVEGTCFSIKMYGLFDSVKDELDVNVRVQFAKSDSMAGKLLHPLTWPFTKLLLEFRLTGSPEHPKWKYVSVVDRVLEVVK